MKYETTQEDFSLDGFEVQKQQNGRVGSHN